MDGVLVSAAAGFIFLIACFGILFSKLIKRNGHSPEFSLDHQSIFSPERYREMERLLDIKLSYHQGGSSFKLRNERARVLRSYIDQLSHDFHNVCAALKLIMVNSQVDRPDLARVLAKQRLSFAFATLAVKFKLILYRVG